MKISKQLQRHLDDLANPQRLLLVKHIVSLSGFTRHQVFGQEQPKVIKPKLEDVIDDDQRVLEMLEKPNAVEETKKWLESYLNEPVNTPIGGNDE